MFEEERSAVSKEMETFIQSFKKQSEAAAERNSKLTTDYKDQLEVEKEEAKRVYKETEMRKATPKPVSKKA